MFNELEITNSFHFGAKVKFTDSEKEFCLIGFTDNHFVLTEWEKRGGIEMKIFEGSVYRDLELIID